MNLYAFLNPVKVEEKKEIVISERFKDENGKVVPFVIKALTHGEVEELTKKSRKVKKVNGQNVERIDQMELTNRIIVAGTVQPPFENSELCENYKVMDPLLVPGKMLLEGEYKKLLDEISALAGYQEDEEEQIKN